MVNAIGVVCRPPYDHHLSVAGAGAVHLGDDWKFTEGPARGDAQGGLEELVMCRPEGAKSDIPVQGK